LLFGEKIDIFKRYCLEMEYKINCEGGVWADIPEEKIISTERKINFSLASRGKLISSDSVQPLGRICINKFVIAHPSTYQKYSSSRLSSALNKDATTKSAVARIRTS
jgi:hypothetical protein